MAFKPRDKAKKHQVKKGETLNSIAKEAGVTWKELAAFNWGISVAEEVKRALFEVVGCSHKIDSPENYVFSGDENKNGSGSILIPERWSKSGLGLDKIHKIKLKKITPPTVVHIAKLDKWFIPGQEACEMEYAIEGLKDCADKVLLQVFGSNYCEVTDWHKGMGKYKLIEDQPLYSASFEVKEGKQSYPLNSWKGKAEVDKGVLSLKKDGKDRYINVAFSPYTIHFCYYKNDGDKKAQVILEPFWPQWDEVKSEPAVTTREEPGHIEVTWTNEAVIDRGVLIITDKNNQRVYLSAIPQGKLSAGSQEMRWDKKYRFGVQNSQFGDTYINDAENAPYTYKVLTFVSKQKDDSLKIKWEIKNTEKLEHGQIQITDTKGKLVYKKALSKEMLKKAKHEFIWDGKYLADIKNSKNGDSIIPEDMPYRVQIQAHTGIGQAEGLALAAMHTEVRLFVHPETHLMTDNFFEPAASTTAYTGDPQSLRLSLAPCYLGDAVPNDDGSKTWVQYELADAGYHPGRVDGADRDAFGKAIKEFQRSVPKKKTGPKYERLTIDGNWDTAEFKEAIRNMRAGDRRALFGNPAGNRADLLHSTSEERKKVNKVLEKHERDLIVWVEARHFYTTSSNNQALVTVDNYHGKMGIGDGLVQNDSGHIPRPWIPLQADLFVLSRTKELHDTEGARETGEDTLAFMRAAIGPLRVDWSFNEIGPDVSPIATAPHLKERVRSKRYVEWALRKLSADYKLKTPERNVLFTNCPKKYGGIRPDGGGADPLNKYYKEPFGSGDTDSLGPWQAEAVDETESIATVIHDHLCPTQPKDTEPLDSKSLGRAGVYFRPSIMGGDGYQIRAQLRLKKIGGSYEFPNLEALEKRYPKLPQAHSARMRLWRKTSVRARLTWGSTTDHFNGMRDYYAAAHVHLVHELGAAAAYNPSELLDKTDNTDFNKYKTLIADKCSKAWNKDKSKIDLDDNYCYPWWDVDRLGWELASGPDLSFNDMKQTLIAYCESQTWAKFQEALLLDMARRIEEKDGRFRGHLLAPFVDTRSPYVQHYKCQSCGKKWWYLEKDATGDTAIGKTCESCGVSGASGIQKDGVCEGRYSCNAACGYTWTEPNDYFPNGGKYTGWNCPGCGASTLKLDGANQTTAPSAARRAPRSIVNYGIGNAGGVTWLCDSFSAWEWAHEVGHHRHLEHSADAPVGTRTAERDKLHDAENNSIGGFKVNAKALNKRWDRCCIMSYVDATKCSDGTTDYEPAKDLTYFCGKCLLRGRGWKVEDITDTPGTNVTVP